MVGFFYTLLKKTNNGVAYLLPGTTPEYFSCLIIQQICNYLMDCLSPDDVFAYSLPDAVFRSSAYFLPKQSLLLSLKRRDRIIDACADVSTDEELLEALESIIEPYRDRSSKLVQVLAEAQQRIGYLPKWVQERVAKGPGLSLQGVYGVVTFYAYFCLISKGRHKVCVCTRTACYVKGSNIETVRCIGACGLVPAMN